MCKSPAWQDMLNYRFFSHYGVRGIHESFPRNLDTAQSRKCGIGVGKTMMLLLYKKKVKT